MRTQGGVIDLLVGSRIRKFRKGRGMTQAQLREKLGVTFQQIQKYKNGGNRVSANRLQMISTALGVPVGQLFMMLERVERPQNHWHSIRRRYGLPKHLSGSMIKRCATRLLISLRPWRESRRVSDMYLPGLLGLTPNANP
jgi:transcriptional regulator with XRE-family HTH domain